MKNEKEEEIHNNFFNIHPLFLETTTSSSSNALPPALGSPSYYVHLQNMIIATPSTPSTLICVPIPNRIITHVNLRAAFVPKCAGWKGSIMMIIINIRQGSV